MAIRSSKTIQVTASGGASLAGTATVGGLAALGSTEDLTLQPGLALDSPDSDLMPESASRTGLTDAPTSATPTKPVSLRDLARMANVSVATVSMVLNENPRISRATQLKVQRLIERTGYKPNRIAQSLSSKYTRVIAVMLPALRHAFADAYFGELISGVCDRAGKLGHKVMLESAKPDFIKDKRHIELFERRYVDGALLLGFNDRHGWLADLVQRGYSVVSANNYLPQLPLGHVTCDYRGGAEQIMNYLLQLGHRKIGLICGATVTATQREIIETYRARLAAHGIETDESWVEDGRFTEAGGAAAAEKLLDRHPDVTAMFGGNDKMAVGAIYMLTRKGMRVPEDVSVTGFDDIQHTAYVNPALTTVHVPLYEVGALACERLIERIRGRSEKFQMFCPHTWWFETRRQWFAGDSSESGPDSCGGREEETLDGGVMSSDAPAFGRADEGSSGKWVGWGWGMSGLAK